MGLRENLNNPLVATVVIGLIAGCVTFIWLPKQGQGRLLTDHGFFYDLDRHELIAMKMTDELPPIQTDDSTKAVRAIMFGCGSCVDEGLRSVGYLEMWDERGKAAMSGASAAAAEQGVPGVPADVARAREAGHLVARLPRGDASPQWHAIDSTAGREITQISTEVCKDPGKLRQCSPLASDLR